MSISLETLKQALQIKELVASLEARLDRILRAGGQLPDTFSTPAPVKKGRRTMSAAAKAKISAAAKARWAKQKGMVVTAENAVVKSAKKAKRTLSPEGRARIIAALKKRWAAKRKKVSETVYF